MVRRVGHPTSLNELKERLPQIWNEMSQDIVQNFYVSMPDRITSCIRARGFQQVPCLIFGGGRSVVSLSIVKKSNLSHRLWQHPFLPFGKFTEINRTVTCMVFKANVNDRRSSSLLPRGVLWASI
ncbi:hypothetical protein TNCV_2448151 [Trichonephila clavipes]|uniref:Uncharacterized protein n=1 Tax=Trichonephila clavipes TaxID=2585209 RepID=A0A8X6VM36_TRICX|nr:hypothetical protein TNCV_2448151 [Trichonephila clavipes]